MTTNNPQDLQVGDLVKLTGPGWAERRGHEVRISRIDDRGQARFEDERVGAVGDWVADEQPGDDWAVERVLTPAGLRISVNKVIADDNGIAIEGQLPEGYTFNDVPQLSIMRGANTRFPDEDPWAPAEAEADERPADAINPSHYRRAIEVADFIETYELDFFAGNVVKYVARAGHKDPSKKVEDLEKALWYMTRKVEVARKQRDEALAQEVIP